MEKINAILIDDESHATDTLHWLLKEYCPNVAIQSICNSASEGVLAINKFNPDLVFLDIEMPVMGGFEMLENVENLDFHLIFTTAYDQYAIKAFKVCATDYLLKPIDKDELKAAINKIAAKPQISLADNLENLFNKLYSFKRLSVPTLEGIKLINFEDIAYCNSDGSYTIVHLLDGRSMMVSKTLKYIENMLPSPPFVRIHNSHIVNLNEVDRYVRGAGGYVIMKNKKHIDVSRSRKNDLLKFLENQQVFNESTYGFLIKVLY